MKKSLLIMSVLCACLLIGYGVFSWSQDEETQNQNEVIVYETAVEDESECTSYETFDEEQSICYFECADEQECREIEQAVEEEYEALLKALDEGSGVSEEEQPSEDTEFSARYDVGANESLTHTSGDDRSEFRTLWSNIALLSPDNISNQFIEEFVLYEDGADDTLAYVVDDDADGKWQYGINYATHSQSTKTEQTSTLIHELAHIITLNSSQVSPDTSSCNTYQTDEGCASASSYLNNFVSRFWTVREQTYDPSVFVTEYAATNPEEDIAESFAYFIVTNNQNTAPTEVKDQKIAFFNEYAELVAMREDMRSAIARTVIRERRAN